MHKITIVPSKDQPICDFCSSPKVWTSYQCEDFVMGKGELLETSSVGQWAACNICAQLIDAGKWDELLQRSIDTFMDKHAVIPREVVTSFITRLHKMFREHMKQSS